MNYVDLIVIDDFSFGLGFLFCLFSSLIVSITNYFIEKTYDFFRNRFSRKKEE